MGGTGAQAAAAAAVLYPTRRARQRFGFPLDARSEISNVRRPGKKEREKERRERTEKLERGRPKGHSIFVIP